MMAFMDSLQLWMIFGGMVLLFLLAAEIGFRFGGYRRQRTEAKISHAGAIVGATLALSAFMLAFTFGMGGSRFDARKLLVVKESNAVGTAYLRSALLPEPHRTEVRNLLREYATVRLNAAGGSLDDLSAGLARSDEIQRALWDHAVRLGQENGGSIVIGLFIQSLNDIIDLHTERLTAAVGNRIPEVIWVTLFFIGFLGNGVIGYRAGLAGTRGLGATLILILAYSAVMLLIMDLDRPGQSLFSVSQQSMVTLLESMDNPPAAAGN
jgi:hypothetical protein